MKCLICHKHNANHSTILGILPCNECAIRQKEIKLTTNATEFTKDSIKEERRAYKKKIIQPWRGDTLSKEYLEEYGTKGIVAEKEDVDNARYTWSDLAENYYKEH